MLTPMSVRYRILDPIWKIFLMPSALRTFHLFSISETSISSMERERPEFAVNRRIKQNRHRRHRTVSNIPISEVSRSEPGRCGSLVWINSLHCFECRRSIGIVLVGTCSQVPNTRITVEIHKKAGRGIRPFTQIRSGQQAALWQSNTPC